MKYFTIFGLISTLLLGACVTPYHALNTALNPLGGIRATQLTSDTAQITARGNPLTDPDLVQRYVIRLAADTTVTAGYDLFSLDPEFQYDHDRTIKSKVGLDSLSLSILIPGETLIIKMYKYPTPKPTSEPMGMWDARDIQAHLGTPVAASAHK